MRFLTTLGSWVLMMKPRNLIRHQSSWRFAIPHDSRCIGDRGLGALLHPSWRGPSLLVRLAHHWKGDGSVLIAFGTPLPVGSSPGRVSYFWKGDGSVLIAFGTPLPDASNPRRLCAYSLWYRGRGFETTMYLVFKHVAANLGAQLLNSLPPTPPTLAIR